MSAIRNSLLQYVAVRRALGSKFYEPALALDHFVDLLEHEGTEFITTDLALRWAMEPKHAQRATWGRRLSQVRGFAKWLNAVDVRNEIPSKRLLNARRRRNAPHIYTAQEIDRLMAQAARLRSPTGMRAMTYSTLIGLLVATGLRPSEAIGLDRSDVDLVNGILSIRETKFGKSRFVPVEESTRAALERYTLCRDRLCPLRVGAAVARRAPQRLLDFERQAVDAQAHIDGFDRQPQLFGADHRNRSRNHWPQAVASDAGQRIATTVCCRRISTSMVLEGASLGVCTRTGTRDGAGRFAGTPPGSRSTPITMSLRC